MVVRTLVALLSRNWTLFCCIFRSHYCVWSAVTQYFCYGWDSYPLCKLMNTWYLHTAHITIISPTLNGNSALQCFEHSNVMEICNEIMFDFYSRLPHVSSLKDAAGSSFGKADRLHLYLHVQKLCWVGEHQHQLAHQCSPNIIGIYGWLGIYDLMDKALSLNGWGIYGLMGGVLWLKWLGQ